MSVFSRFYKSTVGIVKEYVRDNPLQALMMIISQGPAQVLGDLLLQALEKSGLKFTAAHWKRLKAAVAEIKAVIKEVS